MGHADKWHPEFSTAIGISYALMCLKHLCEAQEILVSVLILQQSHSVSVTSTVPMELSEPIDYEDFVKKNQSLLEGSPQKDLLLFPEDDVTVTTLPRKLRTVDVPVPGAAK